MNKKRRTTMRRATRMPRIYYVIVGGARIVRNGNDG